MTTTTIRAIRIERDGYINLSDIPTIGDGAILELYIDNATQWSERCIHLGDGNVLGVACDGEYFSASYDRDGHFAMGCSTNLDGANYPDGVVEALNA